MKAVWPDVRVEENSVNQCVSAIRRALGEKRHEHRFIVTEPGRGYRFVAQVTAFRGGTFIDAGSDLSEVGAGATPALLARVTSPRPLPMEPRDRRTYQLYLAGVSALLRPGSRSLTDALQRLEQAAAREPLNPITQTSVATCYALLGINGLRAPHDVFPRARSAVQQALAVDSALAEAHAESGHIHTVYDRDFGRAEAAYRRALEIDPHSATTYHYMGILMLSMGELSGALDAMLRACDLDPLAPNYAANAGMTLYFSRRYTAAIEQLEATLEIDDTNDHARSLLGRSLLQLREYERAIDQFLRRTRPTIGSAADLPVAYAFTGRRAEARSALEQLVHTARTRYVSPYDIATVYAALGDDDATVHWLDRALDQRAQPINCLPLDPIFDRLQSSREWTRLFERWMTTRATE
jgi:tetratricopeptide (TPR) repeat protein